MKNNTYDNSQVRRRDRLLNEQRALELLEKGEYGVLAMVDVDQTPYAVPINFVYDGDNSIYLHCAPEGHKLRALAQRPAVEFLIVGNTHVLSSKFTTNYESVVIRGKAHIGLPEDERHHALHIFLEKYCPDDMKIGLVYAEKSFFRTDVIRIDIDTMSGKCKNVK